MSQTAIDIIGVPLDLGVTELGLKLGPDAFREAGLVQAAESLQLDVRDLGNIEPQGNVRSSEDRIRQIAGFCRELARVVQHSLAEGRVPVCLGGDHSLAIGSLAGARAELGRVGCVWLDAHPDANTPETSPSGNIHGMPVAILVGRGPAALVDLPPAGPKIECDDIVVLGARDMDPGEVEFLRSHQIDMYTVFDLIEEGLQVVMNQSIRRVNESTCAVHVSMDLDVLHEEIAPGVGLPSRCGLTMREALYVCRRLASGCRVGSIDIVGLNPVRDRGATTAKRAIELLMALLGRSFTFNYNQYLKEQRE